MDTGTPDMLIFDRLQFAAAITFHYLFPQLTMGLALLIALLGTFGYWWNHEGYQRAAHFWTTIFAITFAFGVATGVPMEFQFGTNWANFSRFAGGRIGQTLALEGVFAFFLESSFLGVMLVGEKRVGARLMWLATFPRDEWPDLVPLVYYAYHIMVGLGPIFVVITGVAVFLLWRGKLFESRWMLWVVMLATPFPYIATTAGWVTTEVGRQPWLAYGLFRTADGLSPLVSSGNTLFTFLGFLGLYLLLGIAYIILVFGLVGRGPMRDIEVPEYSQAPATSMVTRRGGGTVAEREES